MLFPDYHFHTDFSSDCDEPIQAVIASAKEKGLSALCVTDHYDMDFPVRPEEPDVDFDLDLDSYYRTYHALSEKLVPEFDLRVGVELGVMPSTTKKLNAFVQAHPELDFIICSLHVVDGMDPYYPEYFEGKEDLSAYRHYFETLLACVKEFDNFNVCGHLDYIVRYGKTKADLFDIRDYADIFEELFQILVARQGLKGVLIIHEDRGAGYPWSVVRASAQSKMYVDSDSDAYHCPLNGWIQFNAAKQLLADNGYDIDQLIEQSKSPDFKPISLKSTVTVSMRNTFDRQQSPNVIGYIPGSGNTDESVIYLGHWDHLGYGAPINGDSIINGATDNAVAIAWMLEMARCLNALKEKPRRNIVFLSPTCEETGFLGTKYYVEHPLFPIDKIAAVINLDVFPLWGENNDVTITGYGNSELDDTLAELAKKDNRYIMPDPDAYNGMFYRSDHFPFVQKGIPAMFAKGWNDNRKQGKEWAKEHIARYWAETYHKPTDQTHPDTDDYSGLLQEVQLFFDLGYKLAQDTGYPKWKPKSEFANVLKR